MRGPALLRNSAARQREAATFRALSPARAWILPGDHSSLMSDVERLLAAAELREFRYVSFENLSWRPAPSSGDQSEHDLSDSLDAPPQIAWALPNSDVAPGSATLSADQVSPSHGGPPRAGMGTERNAPNGNFAANSASGPQELAPEATPVDIPLLQGLAFPGPGGADVSRPLGAAPPSDVPPIGSEPRRPRSETSLSMPPQRTTLERLRSGSRTA